MLWYIYLGIITVDCILGVCRYRSLSKSMHIILWSTIGVLAIEVLKGFVESSYAISHIAIAVEVGFLSFYYFGLLGKYKALLIGLGCLGYGATVIFYQYNTPLFWNTYPNYTWILCVITSVWSVVFFYQLIKKPMNYSLQSDGNFWINCAHILFYPGTLLFFGLDKYLGDLYPNAQKSILPINHILNLVLYAIYGIAFWMDRRKSKRITKDYL
jgi:hypothetical protein